MNSRKRYVFALAAGGWLSLGASSQNQPAAPATATAQRAPSDTTRAACAALPNDTPSIAGLQSAWAIRDAGSSNIRLVFSNQAAACSNPDLTKMSPDRDDCIDGWHFAFTLSPDLQKPGIYDLHDYEADYAESVVTTVPAEGCRGGPACTGMGRGSAGGGKGPDSTIEIYSVTDDCVTGRILRLERGGGSSDVDFTGGFQAVVCTPSSP